MIKEFIGTGKTIEEATTAAKLGLNAPLTADVKIEVVAMPEKKKFFGLIGGCDAQVKASYDDGVKEKNPKPKKQPAAPAKSSVAKKPERKKAEPVKQEESKPARQEAPVITDSDIDLNYVCSYLKTMIDGFKIPDAKITAKVVNSVVEIDINCDDYGIIIGRRGETLDALQYLTSLAIKRSTDKYVRVTVNVGDYRAKREQTLKALATKNANYVIRSGKRYSFEPMNPYERRIIHTAVQEVDGASSRSIGSGMDRRVVIEPVGGVRQQSRGSAQHSSRPSRPSSPTPSKPIEKDLTKFGKIEVNKD